MPGSIERQLDSWFNMPPMAPPFEKKPPTPWRPPPTTKILPLSPLDRAMCRVYVRLIYLFPLADPSTRPAALSHLRTRLAATLAHYPFLAGTVDDDNNNNSTKLRYPSPLPDVTTTNDDDDEGDTTFRILTVRQDVALPPYEQLAAQAMPPSALHKELLSNLPTHPVGRHQGGWPALGVQANFFEGGLALCFAFHHAVLDGTGMRRVLEVFAGAGAAAAPTARDLRRTVLLSMPRAGGGGESLREYEGEGVMAALPREREGNKSRVLRFGAEGLGRLKGEVMKEVKRGEGAGGVAFVSTSDVLCALVWVGVMRARWLRGRGSAAVSKEEEVLSADEVARFNIAVNARTKMKPALPAGYVGNAFVVAVAEATVGEVVGFHGEEEEEEEEGRHEMLSSPSSPPAAAAPSGRNKTTTTTTLNNPFHHPEPTPPSTPPQQPTTLPPLTIHTIARAATHIRRAIAAVHDAYVRARFSFVASLPPTSNDPTAITKENNTATLKQALDPARTGLDFASWDAFGADFDFGIPGTTADGKPAWVRKTWSAGEGAVNILPRKAGAEWFEVLLALAAEDMDAVCGGGGVGLRGCEWWGGEWVE